MFSEFDFAATAAAPSATNGASARAAAWRRSVTVLAMVCGGLLLAACTTGSTSGPTSDSHSLLNFDSGSPGEIKEKRDLTMQEKKIIMDAVNPSVRDANAAQYKWPKITDALEGNVNYCGTVNAKSPYPAYNGRQAFIVEATLSGGKVTGAVIGLIAGGKDFDIVSKMCAKYGLNPADAGG
jgi:hypothetical protein